MLTTPTIDKLHSLNLMGMARALQEQMEKADYQALTFEERLGLMVDREEQDRENRRLYRYLKAAKLRSNASIEDLDFHRSRGLDRSMMLALADARWVEAKHSILIVGCVFRRNGPPIPTVMAHPRSEAAERPTRGLVQPLKITSLAMNST